jgi:glycosyltransferase involved in cell wall biosynthesis
MGAGEETPRRAAHVSVVIPTCDRPALLREALASVRALEGDDLALEVIVADNGATDEADAVAREFGARRLRVPAPGAAAARNAGLRAATGEYVAFLDDDDVWLAGHLRPHLALLRAHPELGAVVGQVVNSDMALEGRSEPWPAVLPQHGDLFPTFLGLCPQLGATVARAEVLQTVGPFDETLIGDQDWDWHLRLASRHLVGFVPVPCVLFRVRPTGTRDDVHWMRAGYTRRVFWTNVRRARCRRLPLPFVVRTYLRQRGRYAVEFLASAGMQASAGQRREMCRALRRAVQLSPPHVVWALSRDAQMRRSLGRALRGAPQLR